MKVVLFYGGQGLRMRGAAADGLPKPMVPLGRRPLLWHVMRYYAHWGHKDFILCLGHGGEAIKGYFAANEEWRSEDFVLAPGGGTGPEPLLCDAQGWRVTFVDTGAEANIGERLLAVRPHLRGEEMFLANYADGLTDHPLPRLVEDARDRGAVGAFLATRPGTSFHFVEQDADGVVRGIRPVEETALRVNGGFFVFRREIFDYIRPGEELVEEPFARLVEEGLLLAHRHDGFWRSCDTFKDLRALEGMMARGPAPWELWRRSPPGDEPAERGWLGPQIQPRLAPAPLRG
ncbi:MAG: glucose-1-phosphate cytidylyltransferase [Acetobacteraceae bacterium]|nr:glucose-1-phosphate cytidylyltransferase [Acetobacteraceae bacterium]